MELNDQEPTGMERVWLSRAKVLAENSPCSVQVGAILVNRNGRLFQGVNRPPDSHPHGMDGATKSGCDQWCARRLVEVGQKCPGYTDCETVHAEAWALQRAGLGAQGGTLYVTGPPCNLCVRGIAGAGVRSVVFYANERIAVERRMELAVAYLVRCRVNVKVVMEP